MEDPVALHPSVESILTVIRSQPSVHPRTQSMSMRRTQYREMALALWPTPTDVGEVTPVTLSLIHI